MDGRRVQWSRYPGGAAETVSAGRRRGIGRLTHLGRARNVKGNFEHFSGIDPADDR